MGVQDLWSILETVRESVPLYSLSGKTLAVDLSLWVCEAQHVQAMMGRVTKPHLRVSSLTLMGVKLVFVMEGEAPKLKAETMTKRTEARLGGFKKASACKSTNTSRGRFKAVLRECAEMLDYLGVPWVTAAGEAEAMCAYLDSQGLVDGCITNDGDAFLYGARTVYRNFNMNSKDPQVDCYQTSQVQTELHLSRENLVGLAILLGCDYIPKGVTGVGKEQALKLIQTLKGQTLLQRFTQWKEDSAGVSERAVKKVPHCHVCRHPGRHSQVNSSLSQRYSCFICKGFHAIKFAYDKMEWPKHYTCEKVLVLMTYAELMNRKYGREMTSQIKPLRILKPRVRNGVACFEVIWNTPEHYVFPEDRPAEGQHEVRTVEEESLFRVAFPELVESYLRDKALSEENKTKKKKPKSKKEKPSDVSGGISDLLAQMSLQSSSSANSATQPQTLFPKISNTEKPEVVVILDSPVSHKQHSNLKEAHSSLGNCPNTPLSNSESDAAVSPSVSAVVDALHLSDIDWETSSFTSSPPPQAATNHTAGLKRNVKETQDENTSGDVKQADSRSAPGLSYTDFSLRDRLLMRNTAKTITQREVHNDVVSKQLNYELGYLEHIPPHNLNSKPCGQISCKGDSDDRRCHSDPGQSDKDRDVPQTTKKSVCLSVCSSSEDSDAENQQFGPQRKAK
ncbi:hypothetical protein INR49_029973, partial [Caranx melampygus]